MTRLAGVFILSLFLLAVGASLAIAQAPPYIEAAQQFLLGWGRGDWQAMRAQALERVTVKVAGTDYSIDLGAKTADVRLVFPFRGLSAVRVGASVKGVTVDEITVRAGGAERKGKGTVTLEEKAGRFIVTTVAVE